jgi:hypothetical protein
MIAKVGDDLNHIPVDVMCECGHRRGAHTSGGRQMRWESAGGTLCSRCNCIGFEAAEAYAAIGGGSVIKARRRSNAAEKISGLGSRK